MSNRSQRGSETPFSQLSTQQREILTSKLERFEKYLRTEGKDPLKEIGFAEREVPIRVSRVKKAIKFLHETEGVTIQLTPDHGDHILESLKTDDMRKENGDPYDGGSKRKIKDALVTWYEFSETEWNPEVTFETNGRANHSDPFAKWEAQSLWEVSLNYKNIPKYKNLSPEDRDRWRVHLAQELGKPKEQVTPDDWDRSNTSWKIPSLVGPSRRHGLRPALINRAKTDWYEWEPQKIIIPPEDAVKNNSRWTVNLTSEDALALEKWLNQRANMSKYDDSDRIWLTREATPYNSGSLNNLLDNLIEQAGINQQGRKLTWYSFRHYVGTYTYEKKPDLRLVAEKLRQNSIQAADRYVHPTDELMDEVTKSL